MTTDVDDLLDPASIAELFGVGVETVWTWRARAKRKRAAGSTSDRLMPEPAKVISNRFPVWDRAAIEAWGRATGRLS